MGRVYLVLFNAEYDFWDVVIQVEQNCELCNNPLSFVSEFPTSDGDTIPNCEACIRNYTYYVERIVVA